MRQWMFVFVAVCGLASTSGWTASNTWTKPSLGEFAHASDYQAVKLACGRTVYRLKEYGPKFQPAAADRTSVAPSKAGSALGSNLMSRR